MMVDEERLSQLLNIKSRYESELLRKPNVVGVGVGLRRCKGRLTDQPAIVVSVSQKQPREELAPDEMIPNELDGMPVDVQAVGRLRAQ